MKKKVSLGVVCKKEISESRSFGEENIPRFTSVTKLPGKSNVLNSESILITLGMDGKLSNFILSIEGALVLSDLLNDVLSQIGRR